MRLLCLNWATKAIGKYHNSSWIVPDSPAELVEQEETHQVESSSRYIKSTSLSCFHVLFCMHTQPGIFNHDEWTILYCHYTRVQLNFPWLLPSWLKKMKNKYLIKANKWKQWQKNRHRLTLKLVMLQKFYLMALYERVSCVSGYDRALKKDHYKWHDGLNILNSAGDSSSVIQNILRESWSFLNAPRWQRDHNVSSLQITFS